MNEQNMVNDTSQNNYAVPLTAKLNDDDSKEVHTLMVHYDAIFDMRAAALRIISQEYLNMIKIDESYYKRQYDVFGDQELGILNKSKLDEIVYKLVDPIAQSSQMTRVFELMLEYISEYMNNTKMSPHAQHIKVLLNFGHYPFSDEQKLKIYDYINGFLDPMGVAVMACDYTIAQLDQNVLNGVDSLFIYDWMQWLELHQKAVESFKIKTKLHCPKVVPIPNGEIDKIDQAKQMLKDLRMTPYDFIKKGISRFIGMSFIDIVYWCELDAFNNPIVEEISLKSKQ